MKDCAPEKVGSSAPPFNPPVKALSIVPGSLNSASSNRQRVQPIPRHENNNAAENGGIAKLQFP
jgi:hypothetical protein